jgi:hypothetical protein
MSPLRRIAFAPARDRVRKPSSGLGATCPVDLLDVRQRPRHDRVEIAERDRDEDERLAACR